MAAILTHRHGIKCGCGAIDNAPTIVENAIKYQEQITNSIEALGVGTEGLDAVFSSYTAFAPTMDKEDYSGEAVMQEIVGEGVVTKELDGDHKEMYVVLNMVEGKTVNQALIRELTDGKAQVFAVDVWRMLDVANRLYADETEEVRHQAFLSELVYTLATAATLTKGDLPVYVISKQPELVAA